MKLHLGKVTASGVDNLLTPEWKLRTGEMPKTYVYRKAAELWRGEPLLDFGGSFMTEQGQMLEDEAMAFACLEYGYRIEKLGFCETDDHRAGCSPDALLREDSGVELKCPAAHTHVKYLCDATLPKEYAAQVFFSMWVCDRPEWVFMSYQRGFPPLHLVIKREEEIMAKIASAVDVFSTALAEAMSKMKAIA